LLCGFAGQPDFLDEKQDENPIASKAKNKNAISLLFISIILFSKTIYKPIYFAKITTFIN
jgi:hypothetical protein